MRPNKDTYFLQLAHATAERATCVRRKVGAVVVDDRGRILSTGYNGSPQGYPHCEDLCGPNPPGPCQWSVHAEINALLFAENRQPHKTLYVTTAPCRQCALAIANAGIDRVVIAEPFRHREGLDVLETGGIHWEIAGESSCHKEGVQHAELSDDNFISRRRGGRKRYRGPDFTGDLCVSSDCFSDPD